MFYLFVLVHPCCEMFQWGHITRTLWLCSRLTPRSVSLLFPLSLFLRQCFPSFLYLICRLRHDDSVTNSILLDLVPGYVQCCRKGICYIARADITRYFLTLKLQVRFFRSQAPGGVETPPIQPERSHITISITLKLLN